MNTKIYTSSINSTDCKDAYNTRRIYNFVFNMQFQNKDFFII